MNAATYESQQRNLNLHYNVPLTTVLRGEVLLQLLRSSRAFNLVIQDISYFPLYLL